MQNIRFSQSINLEVTYDVSFPSDWSQERIHEALREFPAIVTVDTVDNLLPEGVVSNETKVDGVDINSIQVW